MRLSLESQHWLCGPPWQTITDTMFNKSMRIVCVTIKSTILQWLPVLTNILPPQLQRKTALLKEWRNCCNNTLLSRHQHYLDRTFRLKSRWLPWNSSLMRLSTRLMLGGKSGCYQIPDDLHIIPDQYWKYKWGLDWITHPKDA